MARTDEMEAQISQAARRSGGRRWIVPALGAVVGFLLASAIVSLAAAFVPEGSETYTTLGLTLRVIGTLLGLFAGGILIRPRR